MGASRPAWDDLGPSESPQLYIYRGVRRVDFERPAKPVLVATPLPPMILRVRWVPIWMAFIALRWASFELAPDPEPRSRAGDLPFPIDQTSRL